MTVLEIFKKHDQERVGITFQLPESLNKDLNTVLLGGRFKNRSEFIRYALIQQIKEEINKQEFLDELALIAEESNKTWEPKYGGGKSYRAEEKDFVTVDGRTYWKKRSNQ